MQKSHKKEENIRKAIQFCLVRGPEFNLMLHFNKLKSYKTKKLEKSEKNRQIIKKFRMKKCW